jgi:hypothetical protein
MINIFPGNSKDILIKLLNIILFSIIFWLVGIILIANSFYQLEKYIIKNLPKISSSLGITDYLKSINYKKKFLILPNNPYLLFELSLEDESNENYSQAYEKMVVALALVEINGNPNVIQKYKERVKYLLKKVSP